MGSNKHVKGADYSPPSFKPCTKFSIGPSGFVVEIEYHERQKKLLKGLLVLGRVLALLDSEFQFSYGDRGDGYSTSSKGIKTLEDRWRSPLNQIDADIRVKEEIIRRALLSASDSAVLGFP